MSTDNGIAIENVARVEELADSLMKRLGPRATEMQWHLEQPGVGHVFTIRNPQWRFSEAGGFFLAADEQGGQHLEFKMLPHAYTEFMALPTATPEMQEQPYLDLLAATALKLGAYRGLVAALKANRTYRDDSTVSALSDALDTVAKSVTERISTDVEAAGDDVIPLNAEGFEAMVSHTQAEYEAAFKKALTKQNHYS